MPAPTSQSTIDVHAAAPTSSQDTATAAPVMRRRGRTAALRAGH